VASIFQPTFSFWNFFFWGDQKKKWVGTGTLSNDDNKIECKQNLDSGRFYLALTLIEASKKFLFWNCSARFDFHFFKKP
jgi:hypothetical protein